MCLPQGIHQSLWQLYALTKCYRDTIRSPQKAQGEENQELIGPEVGGFPDTVLTPEASSQSDSATTTDTETTSQNETENELNH